MTIRTSKRTLVIDASVAQAAALPHSLSDRGHACRRTLIEVLKICHRCVMTDAIEHEWDGHASRFSRQWLVSMAQKGKLVSPRPSPLDGEAVLEGLPEDDGIRGLVEKDMLLLFAATGSDGYILSLDGRTRRHLANNCRSLPAAVGEIVWVDPSAEEEGAILWLRAGAPPDSDRRLGGLSTA